MGIQLIVNNNKNHKLSVNTDIKIGEKNNMAAVINMIAAIINLIQFFISQTRSILNFYFLTHN